MARSLLSQRLVNVADYGLDKPIHSGKSQLESAIGKWQTAKLWRDDEGFSAAKGLGEGTRIDDGLLPVDKAVPQGRTVWTHRSDSPQRCFHPADIAEGCGRAGNSEFHRFLQVSCGSSSELEYHLLLTKDLGYINGDDYQATQEKLLELKRMLVALTRKVGSERPGR